MMKPHASRSYEENEQLYHFLVREVQFFKDLKEKHSRAFLNRIFEVLELKLFDENQVLCKYGEMGDTFFIILSGEVGIQVPTNYEGEFDTYLDLAQFMAKNYERINRMKDKFSREVKKLIAMIRLPSFPIERFKSNNELAKFIEELAAMDPAFLEAHLIKPTKKLIENQRFLVNLAHNVRQQAMRYQKAIDY